MSSDPHARDNEQAVQETSRDLVADAERVQQIELEKARLDPEDPRRLELARESAAITAMMASKARFQRTVVEQVQTGGASGRTSGRTSAERG